jgi:hypothetical protein
MLKFLSIFSPCIYGEKKQEPFPTSSWQATKYLLLIQEDMCGPVETSLGGCWYVIIFIDDYTRMTWVHFLKEKSKDFGKFKSFQHMVVNETKEKSCNFENK